MGVTKQAVNLVARCSALGWVVFGASPRGHTLVHHVLNVKISVPIDMIDFWSMESMGLAVKSFNCQTDKLSSIEQRKANVIQDSC